MAVGESQVGGDAALDNRLRDLLSGHYYLVPEDRTVTITVTRKNLAIAIAPLAPADAA